MIQSKLAKNFLTDEELLIIEPLLTSAVQEWNTKSPAPLWFYPLRALQEKVQSMIDANTPLN